MAKANTVASRKAKARRLQNWTAEQIAALLECEWGKDCTVAPREMGQSGTDVRLIGDAQVQFPYSVECKNQETWAIPAWIKQAKENQKDDTDWLLVCKRNNEKPVIVMDADAFFRLLKENKDGKKGS
jgi:hypothetical protein